MTLKTLQSTSRDIGKQAEVKRTALATIEATIQAHMDRLRQTADELKAGTINRFHAAARIRKIANAIAREKK